MTCLREKRQFHPHRLFINFNCNIPGYSHTHVANENCQLVNSFNILYKKIAFITMLTCSAGNDNYYKWNHRLILIYWNQRIVIRQDYSIYEKVSISIVSWNHIYIPSFEKIYFFCLKWLSAQTPKNFLILFNCIIKIMSSHSKSDSSLSSRVA